MENAIGLLCQLLRAIVFEVKEDSAVCTACRHENTENKPVAFDRKKGKMVVEIFMENSILNFHFDYLHPSQRWWWRSSTFPPSVPALWPMTSTETSNSHYLAFTVVFVVIMSGKGQDKLSTRFAQLGLPINYFSIILRTVKRRKYEKR